MKVALVLVEVTKLLSNLSHLFEFFFEPRDKFIIAMFVVVTAYFVYFNYVFERDKVLAQINSGDTFMELHRVKKGFT